MSIKSTRIFQYWNGREYWQDDCFCGSKKEQFSNDYGDKYCCVHQNSPQDCQIDVSTNGMWCPNATLLSKSHICNNNCLWDNNQQICPSNPESCMSYGWYGIPGCGVFKGGIQN